MCKHKFALTTWSKVCLHCGHTERVLTLDTYNVYSAPIHQGYSRSFRFKNKVDKLLGLNSGPNSEDPIWKYLERNRVAINNPFDVREVIRSSQLKNKHYDCVRIFCDAFTNFRVKTERDSPRIREQLVKSFSEIYSMWCIYDGKTFFSYDWILRYLLEKRKSPLVVYLKPRTCKKRNEKYLAKIKRFQDNYGIRNCATLKSRFQSV